MRWILNIATNCGWEQREYWGEQPPSTLLFQNMPYVRAGVNRIPPGVDGEATYVLNVLDAYPYSLY